jgi:hypothetical protein
LIDVALSHVAKDFFRVSDRVPGDYHLVSRAQMDVGVDYRDWRVLCCRGGAGGASKRCGAGRGQAGDLPQKLAPRGRAKRMRHKDFLDFLRGP